MACSVDGCRELIFVGLWWTRLNLLSCFLATLHPPSPPYPAMPPLRQTYSQPLFLPAFVYTAYVEDPPMSAPLSNVTNETRTRRRITPSQLECLETLFAKSTHPSRDARQRAARDTGMCVFARRGLRSPRG